MENIIIIKIQNQPKFKKIRYLGIKTEMLSFKEKEGGHSHKPQD